MNDPQAPAELRSLGLEDLSEEIPAADAPPADSLEDTAPPSGGDAVEVEIESVETETEGDGDSPPDFAGITPPRRRGGAARFITDVIVELGFLPQSRVDAAVEEGKATGRSPEDMLLQSGILSADQLARATAERFGLDHVDPPSTSRTSPRRTCSARRRRAATTPCRSASTRTATCWSRWPTRRTSSRSTT
jgi:hypothetical protein